MSDEFKLEQRGLQLSVWGALGMAALGIGFALLTGSMAVLLDGFFSLIGFGIGLISLKVARLIQQPGDADFQFGYAAFEPMLNLGKGLMIALVTLFAVFSAVNAVLHGGRPINSGWGVVYALVAAVGCLIIALSQHRLSKRVNSPLLAVDSKNWLIDGSISGAVALAFIGGVFLDRSSLAHWVDYLDPVLVILLGVATAVIPISIIRTSLWEALLGAPDRQTQGRLAAALRAVLDEHGAKDHRLRMTKAGRSHYVMMHVIPGGDTASVDIARLDGLRDELERAMRAELPSCELDVVFTNDRKWLEW
jgi:cation diffusion facilitator family transporter